MILNLNYFVAKFVIAENSINNISFKNFIQIFKKVRIRSSVITKNRFQHIKQHYKFTISFCIYMKNTVLIKEFELN